MAAKCGPDVIYLDGAEGGTGAGPHVAAEETGIPLMAAIPEARRALEDVGLVDEIDLVVAGGIRNGGDVAKCLALGAKAVAIGHSALMALNCNKEIPGVTDYEGTVGVPAGQCYHCHTGPLPGRHHHAGPRAAQAPARRGGRQPRLQLPAHAHARGADARARVREDQRAQPRARGPRGAHHRGGRDGPRPARRHQLHPRRLRGARARRDQDDARSLPREPDRPAAASARCGTDERGWSASPRRSSRSTPRSSPGSASPTRRTSAWSRTSTSTPPRPGQDINWLEDVELLEEEGTPAVFDRYSNAFLKIYFPIPEGRENEIARKVLIAHLQAGNSYGIRAQGGPRQVRAARARPVGRGLAHGRRGLEAGRARGLGARRPTDMRRGSAPRHRRRASTGSPRRGTSPSRARRCWSSTRPASPPAPPASPAASCATTTSSPRCPS